MGGRPMARQKRKRTSPEDQELLEAAYNRDPKPDKAARLELVKRVALGEKEVQIWFQNRRQSSRRKSRPLLPHEIAQYQMSRAGFEQNAATSSLNADGLVRYESGVDTESSRNDSPESSSASETIASGPSAAREDHSGHHAGRDPATTAQQLEYDRNSIGSREGLRLDLQVTSAIRASASGPVPDTVQPTGYIANRRGAPSLRHSFSAQPHTASPLPERLDRQLKKASSFVRLSMNAEGKAEVITKDASSPSPPRPRQVVLLEDSTFGPSASPKPPNKSGLQRSFSGRAQDSRAWEFWCDKEARSELGSAAAKESSGSAAGAIGLLRTASGRNILGSLSAKRNSAFSRQITSAKRLKLDGKRSSLQRSSTSLGLGGLQSKHDSSQAHLPKLKHSNSASSFRLKDNDSDKENWSPDGDEDASSQDYDRRTAKRRPGQESDSRYSRGLGGAGKRGIDPSEKSKRTEDDPEADAELAAFMGGGRKNEDLDCVQGLLSLSQGNWR
ncbi:unnamed protein product [Zymoseptoria tritici ST99CH_3D1]|nr:unnamed protein product [Zymoseptoria tritici ST99CH_3D1]